MQQISSSSTRFYKRVFPAIWFGGLVLFAIVSLFTTGVHLEALLGLGLMLVLGFFIMKYVLWDLMDEVWDDGDTLLVINGRKEERIALCNILDVNATRFTNPPRMTLTLREAGTFGKKVTFSPPRHGIGFSKNPLVGQLTERIRAAGSSAK